MRNPFIFLGCTLSMILLLGGCKKAETPASPAAGADQPSTPVKTASERADAKSPAPGSKEAVLLKVKWPVGSRYVYRMDFDQHSTNKIPMMPKPMEQNVTMAMTYALGVTKETPEGGHEVEMEFLANEMEVKMGDQVMMSFDSKEGGKEDAQNPFVGPFKKMIGSKVHFLLAANGSVDKVLDLDQWQKLLTGDAQGPAAGMLGQQFNEGFFHQILDYGRAFPAKPVKVGESWPFQIEVPAGPAGKIAVDSTIKLQKMEERQQHTCAALAMKGTFKAVDGIEAGPMGKMTLENGKATGTSWFDPELGAIIESTSDQSMRLKGSMPGQPGGNRPPMDFTVELGQRITLNLVEIGKTK